MPSSRPSDCVNWSGALSPDGYGVTGYTLDGKWRMARAHRVAYERAKGPIPPGLQIDHLCKNRACINPEHLEAVTPKENVRRSATPGQKVFACRKCGGPLAVEGVTKWGAPQRRCKPCRAVSRKRHA